jgi:hypothetical protein
MRAEPRLHVIQADSRPFAIHGASRLLAYDATDDTEERMRAVNGGSLVHDWDHWSLSVVLNRLKCRRLACDHHVVAITPAHHPDRHVTWGKIRVVLDFLHQRPDADMVAFIDSDAFIRDESGLHALAMALWRDSDRHGALSRDPLLEKNTFINTGCLLLKNTAFTRGFLSAVWDDVKVRPRYRDDWPHEQFAASALVREHRERFFVCRTAVLNTPCGSIVRHAWWKHQFAAIADEELRATVAGEVCPELATAPPPQPFDLAAILDP